MTTSADEDALVAPTSSNRARRVLGFAIGLLLFAAAVLAVVTSHAALTHAMDELARAPLWLAALALALPLLNWHLISVSFWVLTRRYGRVGLGEMHALIGSAWLLNYLPLRPGMFGRLAYHKRVNHIRLKDSVRVLLTSVGLTIVSNAAICAIAYLSFRASPPAGWIIVIAPGPAIVAAGLALAVRHGSAFAALPSVTIAMGVRYFDILTWVARYAVVFHLIGYPVSLGQAALITAVSQAALLVPFVGNGLGVREWGIGLAVPVLARESPRALGLAADLLNRAAEVLIAVPVGLVSSAWLYRRTRGGRGARAGLKPGSVPIDLQSPGDPSDAPSRTGL